MLDTVLVVKDSREYDWSNAHVDLQDCVPAEFLDVTARPLVAHNKAGGKLRLYRGATPKDPGYGMFSFFPAIPAGGDSGFQRPFICLSDEYFNPAAQAPKGHPYERTPDELHCLWNSLVAQVHREGLVLGTRADAPPRRGD